MTTPNAAHVEQRAHDDARTAADHADNARLRAEVVEPNRPLYAFLEAVARELRQDDCWSEERIEDVLGRALAAALVHDTHDHLPGQRSDHR